MRTMAETIYIIVSTWPPKIILKLLQQVGGALDGWSRECLAC